MVHVIAEIEVRDGVRAEFLNEFRRIVPIVRDEDGCIEYGPAIDAATDLSQPVRPNIVTVVEKMVDRGRPAGAYQGPAYGRVPQARRPPHRRRLDPRL